MMCLESIGRNSRKSMMAYRSALNHLNDFITQDYSYNCTYSLNCESIIPELVAINNNNINVNVYELLDSFVSYLLEKRKGITPKTLSLYMTAVRSYLAYYDIDVLSSKFKRKVKMPRLYREDEEAIDASDIRKILLACNNRRLKTILLVLDSGAMRITECLAIRNMDIDFSISPTKIHLRKEFTKTKVARDIYISDEATNYLKQWLDFRYKNPDRNRIFNNEDLVFKVSGSDKVHTMYDKVWKEFVKLLKVAKMDGTKEQGIIKRRKITIHTLRRFCKTVASEQAGTDFSEWFIGHEKSSYWTMKEEKRRKIYATKVMKYLTFLDYSTLETTGKNIEAQLVEKDKEIQLLRSRDVQHEIDMKQLMERQEQVDCRLSEFADAINSKLLNYDPATAIKQYDKFRRLLTVRKAIKIK